MVLKKTLIVGSLLASMTLGGTAFGQTYTPSADFEHRAIEQPDSTGPMVTPGVFNYDAQMFAPMEFTNDKELEPNCGYFFTFDKTLTSVSRPGRNDTSRTDVPIGNDWNWGERYTFGWMTEQDSGWQGSYQTSAGAFYNRAAWDQEFRFIGFLPDGQTTAGEEDGLAGFGPRILQLGQEGFANQAVFGTPDEHANQFHVGEVNRVFRQVLKNGDSFEPYIGARYTNVQDKTRHDAVYYFLPNDADAPDSHDLAAHRFRQHVSNSAIGMQLGGRHNRRRGRWLYSTDGALAASYNQQRYAATDIFFNDRERNFIRDTVVQGNAFVPTLDLEVAMSFNITRDITVRGGTQLMYMWSGIARSNNLPAENNPNSAASDPTWQAERFPGIPTPGSPVTGLIAPTDIGPAGLFNDSFVATGFTLGVEWRR